MPTRHNVASVRLEQIPGKPPRPFVDLTAVYRLCALFYCLSYVACGADVNSQEQFKRLMPDGLPETLNYNFDRAFLEGNPDERNCPEASRAFFSLHINEAGEVKKASGRMVSLSAKLTGVALKWASGLLLHMRITHLKYGNKRASDNMAVPVVCLFRQPAP